MVRHDPEADGARVVGLEQVGDEHQVAQRLGHLLAVDLDEAVVGPVVGEAPAEREVPKVQF